MKKLHSPQILKAFTALLLAVLMLFGTVTTSLAAVVDELAETGASVTFSGTEKLFFNMGAISWWPANGNFVYFYGTSGDAWSANAVQQTGNYYYVTIPAGTWDHVILTRNSVSSGPSFDNKYNQTGNITIESGNNYISAFSENSETATWSTYTPASTAQLKISGQNSASITTGGSVTVAPSLTSNTDYNEIKTHSYAVSPNSGFSRSGETFTFTAAGSYTITDTITYNAKGFSSVTGTATTNSVRVTVVDSAASGWSVAEGMTFYLDDRDSLGSPKFYFASDASGTGSALVTTHTITGKSDIYFAEAPATNNTYIKVTNSDGSIDSGWCPITNYATNTLTYKSGQFYGLQLPITGEHQGISTFSGTNGHVYYDNTLSNWTIDSTNKLYLVVGRDNYQKMYQMSKVNNTDQLYYVKSDDAWGSGTDGYTYIAFVVATSTHNGAYGPYTASNGALAVASSYTNLVSCYDITGTDKSFLGRGMNSGTVSALDMLWIKDSAIDGNGVYVADRSTNEGNYLNRGQKVTAGANGTVSVSYYKATGNNTVTSQSGTVSASSNTTFYPVRTSTFSFKPTPNEGYAVGTVTYDGGTLTGPDAQGNYTFTVTGGNYDAYGIQNISVTFTETSDPVLNSLTTTPTTAGTTGVNLGDSVTLTASNTRPTGNITYTVTKNGTAVTAGTYLTKTSETAAATNTNTFRTEEPGTYVITATMGGSTKTATIVVNEPPAVMLLGLWTGSVGDAWNYSTTLNPDRVMTYMPSGTYAGKYYIELSLPDNRNFYRNETGGNGFKIYDVDEAKWYGLNNKFTDTNENWTFYSSDGNNCELEAVRVTGSTASHTYKFVYDRTTHNVSVYFPSVVTYNNNESTAVSGGVTGTDTTSTLVVPYGGTAKNITPTREGYAFGGWYDNRACTGSQHDFTVAVTSAVTVYAKWTVNTVNVKVHGTQNGVDMNDAVTKSVNGITGTEINANAAASGYVFRGWVVSGSMASHIKLYTDSACTTVYTSGTAVNQLYVKTDGSAGITVDNAIITATYVTNNTVAVTDGNASNTTTAEEYYSSITGRTTNPQDFDYGSAITVAFENLPAGFGIESVVFADGEEVEYVNYGHYISFTMPDHDVTIKDINVTPFTCRITVKNASTVDVDGLSSSGYYSTGADVHTITIVGSDDYYGASVLESLSVKYIGGSTVTVNSSNLTADTAFDGSTLHIVYDAAAKTATITGHIGGNVIITPSCSTQYNVNITSKVMSDVASKYITYNKKSTTADGEVESVVIAELNAYLKLDSAPADEDAAEEAGVAWVSGNPVSTTYDGDTYYLIEADEDGDYIGKFDAGSKMLLVTENRNTKYSFIGWFPGSSTGPELNEAKSTSETYAFELSESSFLYGVVTRDIYIGGQGPGSGSDGFNVSWSNAAKMTYDEANQVYYYETGSLWADDNNTGTNTYKFKIFDQQSTGNSNESGTTNQAVWYNAAKTISYNYDAFKVTLDNHRNTSSNEAAQFKFNHTDIPNANINSNKVRIYYKPSSQEVYVIPVYVDTYHEVYLSNGRIDGFKKIGLTLDTPTQALTNPSSGTATGTTVSDTQTENYSCYKFTGSQDFAFQVTIKGSSASNVEVAGFVVYNMDSGSAITVEAVKSGNVYSGSVSGISANTFICPVYELTDSYISSNNIQAFDVFVNAADVDTNIWGDLVSMYVFGGTLTERDYNGAWPGQLMLPSGKTFSGVVYKKSGESLSGIVFENYNSTSSFFGKFGKRFNYPDWAQTYDYLEPITLMGDGSNASTTVLSFSLKQNNDGYRGSYYTSRAKKKGPYYLDVLNEENNETKPGVVYSYYDEGLGEPQTLFDNYTFEYLTDKDGKNRLNLYGDSVGSASAGYYVICVGDVDYLNDTTPNGKTYTPSTGYNGEYSVEWYVYDANGMFLLHTLSDALYGKTNSSSETSYIVDKLLATGLISNPANLKEKSVKISYEAPNKRDDATRFSGQWYANSTNEKVTVFAGVGMMTDQNEPIVPENPQSSASYGSAAISYTSDLAGAAQGTINGLNWASLMLSDATSGEVTLTATIPDGSTFKGWYSYNEATDSYTKVSDGTANGTTNTYVPKFGTESRYFAMFVAQATYYFNYTGRDGGTLTYSVKATTGAQPAEMTNGGKLDLATVINESTRGAEVSGAAPSVSVFNKTINFNNANANTDNPYEITVEGTVTETVYTLNVYAYASDGGALVLQKPSGVTENYSIKGTYNTPVDLTDTFGDPSQNLLKYHSSEGSVFLGWKKYDETTQKTTGDILSTHPNFGFALSENLVIAPVFGAAASTDTAWHAYVDRNEITREITNATTGTLYNDSIVRFRYGADSAKLASTITVPANTPKSGIIVLAQTKDGYEDTTMRSKFAGLTCESYFNKLRTAGRTSGKISAAGAYAFYIETTKLSNLNRADICQALDYATFSGGQYKLISFIYDGSEYQFSGVTTGSY